MSAFTSHPKFNTSGMGEFGRDLIKRVPQSRAASSWMIIAAALLAFEIFNYSTTEYALVDALGDLSFAGLRWATILALAFCAMDFAGIARLFSPQPDAGQPAELWYLLGAWLLAATMNALLTWWAVSLALLRHTGLGNEILSRDAMLTAVPVFVSVLVWLIRILLIGTFSLSFQPRQDSARREALSRSTAANRKCHSNEMPARSSASRRPIHPAPKPSLR